MMIWLVFVLLQVLMCEEVDGPLPSPLRDYARLEVNYEGCPGVDPIDPLFYALYLKSECVPLLLDDKFVKVVGVDPILMNFYSDSICATSIPDSSMSLNVNQCFTMGHISFIYIGIQENYLDDEVAVSLGHSTFDCSDVTTTSDNALLFVPRHHCVTSEDRRSSFSVDGCRPDSEGNRVIDGAKYEFGLCAETVEKPGKEGTISSDLLCYTDGPSIFLRLFCPPIQCWNTADSDTEVCSGHGVCSKWDNCTCVENYANPVDPICSTYVGLNVEMVVTSVLLSIFLCVFFLGLVAIGIWCLRMNSPDANLEES